MSRILFNFLLKRRSNFSSYNNKRNISLSSVLREDLSCPDYYAILGVNKVADIRRVKFAYFNLAKKYHPDNNQTEEARYMFQLVAEAYEVLSDEKKRADYDAYGTRRTTMGGITSKGPWRPPDHHSEEAEELFEKIFGEKGDEKNGLFGSGESIEQEYGDNPGTRAGPTHEYRASVKFEEAALGTEFTISLSVKALCMACEGSRSEPGYHGNVCPYCEGTGTETERVGHILTRKACGYCNGTREFIKYKCTVCEGTGLQVLKVPYKITIPPASEDGQVLKIRLNDYLYQRTVDNTSHFYVYLIVQPSNYFKRDGLDIHTEAEISVSQALLGGTVSVKGLHEDKLIVPISPGQIGQSVVIIPEEGIKRSDGKSGSHVVHLGIKVPQKLNQKQVDIMKRFAALEEQGGTINGVETPDGHKYSVNVVEPSKITREFNGKLKDNNNKDSSSSSSTSIFEGFKKFMLRKSEEEGGGGESKTS